MTNGSAPYAVVVDDDAPIRMAAASILEDAGFLTFAAKDADEAEALLVENGASITLLFTNVRMPGSRDGFALARFVSRTWPHIAIVVASGALQPKPGDMPDGAHFIGNPFSAETVHAHLQEMLPDGRKPEPLRKL